jgi:hypothetical protein
VLDVWRFLFRRPSGLALVLALACAAYLVRRWREPRAPTPWRARLATPDGLVLLWLAAPVAVAFALSKLWMPLLTTRNLIVVLPAAYALCARALCSLFPGPRAWRRLATLLAAVLAFGLFVSGAHYTRPRHQQFREAAAAVARHPSAPPAAIVLAYGAHAHHFDYYLERLGSPLRVELAVPAWGDANALSRLAEARHPDLVWLLAARREPPPELLTALEARFDPVLHEEFHHTSARLYARRRAPRRGAPGGTRRPPRRSQRTPADGGAPRRSHLRSRPWKPCRSSIAARSSASDKSCGTGCIRSGA